MTAITDSRIRRTDMVIHTILFVVAVLTAGTLIMAIVSFRSISDQRADTASSRRDARLVACQSLWRVDLSEASALLQTTWAEATPLTGEVIEAMTSENQAGLAEALGALEANGRDIQAAVESVDRAQAEYRAAIEASIREPDRFVAECERRTS